MERCRQCEKEAFRYYSSVGICPAENEIQEYLLYFECNHFQGNGRVDGETGQVMRLKQEEANMPYGE